MSDPLYVSEIFSSIQGEGLLAGRRQLFVRLVECNLECRYCDTIHETGDICRSETSPGSGIFDELPQPLTAERVTALVAQWVERLPKAHHSISITGGEPLLQAEALRELLPQLHRLLPIHLETNGTLPAKLEQVLEHLDYISMDMKLPSIAGCGDGLWGLHERFLRKAAGHNVSVKAVVGEETPQEEIARVCRIISAADPATPLFLQPLTRTGGGVAIGAGRLLELQATAAALLPDVRVIPQMHLMLGAL
jgi:organic radical activating enzyme